MLVTSFIHYCLLTVASQHVGHCVVNVSYIAKIGLNTTCWIMKETFKREKHNEKKTQNLPETVSVELILQQHNVYAEFVGFLCL